jgi:hypothetical protein
MRCAFFASRQFALFSRATGFHFLSAALEGFVEMLFAVIDSK